MKLGYLRVSTQEQRPDRQIDGLDALCDELHIEYVSAVSRKRPVYDALMQRLGDGDSFIVWDLDRAFRSTVDALLTAEKLVERGVTFQIVSLKIDTATPASKDWFIDWRVTVGEFRAGVHAISGRCCQSK